MEPPTPAPTTTIMLATAPRLAKETRVPKAKAPTETRVKTKVPARAPTTDPALAPTPKKTARPKAPAPVIRTATKEKTMPAPIHAKNQSAFGGTGCSNVYARHSET